MARSKRKSTAQKPRKSAARLELEHEISLLQRRARDWSKKYHYVVNIPSASDYKRATRSAIESIRNIRISKLTEKQKRQYQANYINKYDTGEIPIRGSEVQYSPPTESQYLETDDEWYQKNVALISTDEYDDDDLPVDSRQEIDAFIDSFISDIASIGDGERVNYEAQELILNLLTEARRNYGDETFYNMLQDEDTVSSLQSAAYAAVMSYRKRNQDGMGGEAETATVKFATILNDNKPLSMEQQDKLLYHDFVGIGLDED